ncbi:MAG TPA: serine/threonine-protein kinase [Planctomycetota bacterium]
MDDSSKPANPESPAVESGFRQQLEKTYGAGVDPSVSLVDDSEAKIGTADPTARLAGPGKDKKERYRLDGEIARGGMGAVFKVFDTDLRRTLAMKVVLSQSGGESAPGAPRPKFEQQLLSRFLEEAQITGQLDHPGVVPVHEIGIDRDGKVYFTMRMVKGQSLDAIFDLARNREGGWNPVRAVDAVLKVCETMAYAHAKGVIHRDLKPANVMVGKFGETYVMDWGLAKVMSAKGREERPAAPEDTALSIIQTDRESALQVDPQSPLLTLDGAILGTPHYMAPEQAAGRTHEIGPLSDVYCVGAMLYRLLTGKPPYFHVKRSVRDVLLAVLAGPPLAVAESAPNMPPELLAICAKAMAYAPADRYSSMMAMAEDLRAYLDGRVVRAHAAGAFAQFRKWVLRNRVTAAALAAVLLLAVGGTVGLFLLQQGKVRAVTAERALTLIAKNQAETNEARALRQGYLASLIASDVSLRANEMPEARRSLADCDPAMRGWEWLHLDLKADTSLLQLDGHEGRIQQVGFCPDCAQVLSASADGTVRLWDSVTGELRRSYAGHDGPVTAAVFLPDGQRVLSLGGLDSRSLQIWGANTGNLSSVHEEPAPVHALALVPGTESVAFASGDSALKLFELRDWKPLWTMDEHGLKVNAVAVDPSGRIVASASQDRSVRVTEVASGEVLLLLEAHEAAVNAVAFGPRGERLASGSDDGTVRIWDARTGAELGVLRGNDPVYALAFSPDGKRLASGSFDKTLRIWDLETMRQTAVLRGHDRFVSSLAFSGDGHLLLSGADDGSVRLWDAAQGAAVSSFAAPAELSAIAVSPDSRRIVTGSAWPGALELREAGSGRVLRTFPELDDAVTALAFRADGTHFVAATEEMASLYVWQVESGELVATLGPHDASVTSADYSPTDDQVASGSDDSSVRIWNARTGEQLADLRGHEQPVTAVRFLPDGKRVVSASQDRTVRIWNLESGDTERVLTGHRDTVWSLAISPDGSRIASGGGDNAIRIWDVASGAMVHELLGHEARVSALDFSGDGKRLVSGSYDRTLRLWDPADGAALLALRGHQEFVTGVAFSPDGARIVSVSADKTLKSWETTPALARFRAREQGD